MIQAATLLRWEPKALGLLRIVTALMFISHAVVKLSGFPAGAEPGLQELTSLFGIAGVIELFLGVLILVGFYTRPAAFLASGEMAIAYWMVHAPASPYPVINHGEVAILFCFTFLYLALSGPGAWSFDERGRGANDGA